VADRHRLGTLVVALAIAAPALSGCGGGPPTEAQFVERMRSTIGDLDAGMKSQNIDPEDGDRLITDLLECQYESIEDDADLLQRAYDDPGDADVTAQLEVKSSGCVETFSAAMTKAAGGGTAATSTTLPGPGETLTTEPLTTEPLTTGG